MKNQIIPFGRGVLLGVFILGHVLVQAQRQPLKNERESPAMQGILLPESKRGWHRFTEEVTVSVERPARFFEQHRQAFELMENNEMTLVSHEREAAHQTDHYTFQQRFQGIRIVGAIYKLHQRNGDKGIQLKGNGLVVRSFTKDNSASISDEAALRAAMKEVNASRYGWESPEFESMIKKLKNDVNASSYPQPELVYYSASPNPEDIAAYHLAYEMKIFALQPESHQLFYVSAETGNVIGKINLIHDTNTPATGTTIYNGTRNIITDFTGSNYVLKETNRGGTTTDISTYDMNNSGTNISMAVNYQNASTTWLTEPVGVQGHWGAEKTFDYYQAVHGRNSFNNIGGEIISYLDYGVNYNNAVWNGVYMRFGAGDGITYGSWAALDVVGHEFTHGVTETSADLIYNDESGALNESFSDIFGTMIEFYGQGNGDWLVSEDVTINGAGIRSMSNPNIFNDPDTYRGTHWFDGADVHTNSGVQNHWFYLLSEGGSGTNDLGNNFTVTGIGRDMAAAIAYRNLTVYLTPNSGYADAREGAIQAAEDLFGTASTAYLQTITAWYAVGIGFLPYPAHDIALKSIVIGGGSCTQLSVEILNSSITDPIPSGAVIDVLVKENGVSKPVEQITLAAALAPGNSVVRSLNQAVTPSGGKVDIEVRLNYLPDPQPQNNILVKRILRDTMTVGSFPGADFFSVQAAGQALKDIKNIICGHITIKIRNGIYGGQVDLSDIEVSSSNHTITFESESGNPDDVQLLFGSTYPGSGFLGGIHIENTDGIRIKNITIVRDAPAQVTIASAISVKGEINDLILEGNKIRYVTTATGPNFAGITFDQAEQAQNNIIIRNNHFDKGNVGIWSVAVYPVPPGNILVEGNQFIDHNYAMRNLTATNLTIKGNTISSPNAFEGISARGAQVLIEENDMNLNGPGFQGMLSGVKILASTPSTAKIINNMIAIRASNNSVGIRAENIQKCEILHNTIRSEKTTPGIAAAFSTINFDSPSTEKIVKNNILFNNASGAPGISLSAGGPSVINYNSFYIPNGFIGKLNATGHQTLPAWRSATGFDVNSIVFDPVFVSTTDLHLAAVATNASLEHGTITSVLSDIDGEVRNIPPYMGADESIFWGMTVSQTNFPDVDQCGDQFQIIVTSGMNWTIQNVAGSFITVNPLSGTPGTTLLTLTVANNYTVKARGFSFNITSASATHTITGSQYAGICDIDGPPGGGGPMFIYPNPVVNSAELHGQIDQTGYYDMTIHNAYGMLKQKQQVYLETGDAGSDVPVNNLSPGIYLLRLTDPSGEVRIIRFEKK